MNRFLLEDLLILSLYDVFMRNDKKVIMLLLNVLTGLQLFYHLKFLFVNLLNKILFTLRDKDIFVC